jgi:hypothetical protein
MRRSRARRRNGSIDYLKWGGILAGAIALSALIFRKSGAGTSTPGPAQLSADSDAPLSLAGQRVLLFGSSSVIMITDKLEKRLRDLGVGEYKSLGVKGSTIKKWSDNNYKEGKSLEKALAEYKPTLAIYREYCINGCRTRIRLIH